MVQEDENEAQEAYFRSDSAVKGAHDELLKASEELLQLADWCDENFAEEDSKEEAKYNPTKLYGGKTLKATGQFAIQALHAISFNIEVLAKNLSTRMLCIGDEIDFMSSEIDLLNIQTRNKQGKDEMSKVKKLSTPTAEKPINSLQILKPSKDSQPQMERYVRKKLDFTVLDQIGYGGVKNIELDAKLRDETEKKAYATVKRSNSVKYATTTRTKTLVKMDSVVSRKVEMPKVPKGSFDLSVFDDEPDDPNAENDFVGDLYEEIEEPPEEEIFRKPIRKNKKIVTMPSVESNSSFRLSSLPPMPDADDELAYDRESITTEEEFQIDDKRYSEVDIGDILKTIEQIGISLEEELQMESNTRRGNKK